MKEKPLTPYEQWMVKSNLATIAEGRSSATDLVATLRRNGYPRIAAEVKRQHLKITDRLEYLRGEIVGRVRANVAANDFHVRQNPSLEA